VIGSVHQTWRIAQSHLVAEEWAERYGPIFKFRVGSRTMVVVNDVDEINRVLRERPDGYRRWREVEASFQEIGFPGVFSVEGDVWRRQRRLVVTALNTNHLHRHFHVVRTATERLLQRLAEAAEEDRSVDLTQLLTAYAADITMTLAFGKDLNTLQHGDGELQRHIQRTFNMLNFRIFFPLAYWRWIQLPPDRRLNRSVSYLRTAVLGFIEEARARLSARPERLEEPENFLEAMLAAQQADSTFTDEEILGNVFTLLLAGEDTTAHTMAWTCWYLAQDRDIQERWAQEARDVLGEAAYPAEHETVSRLPYGEAVLRESMRLKSVANGAAVQAHSDTTICDTRIPAETRLILQLRHVSRRAGGAAFNPERWLEGSRGPGGEECPHRAPDQRSFLAFGAGPRFCPGRNLAFLESKTAMAMIARNFEIELDESGGPVQERLTFTMIPKGLRVRLHARAPRAARALGPSGPDARSAEIAAGGEG
jgi:cytochrome P450